MSAGRKNAIGFEVSGSRSALAWEGERPEELWQRPEELWLGNRDTPNATLLRNAALMSPAARPTTHLPAGHAEGFADTFRELYRAVYRTVAAGEPRTTTRPSAPATSRTCSPRPSRFPTQNNDGWR